MIVLLLPIIFGILFYPQIMPVIDHIDTIEINYIIPNNNNPFGTKKYLFWDNNEDRPLIDSRIIDNEYPVTIFIGKYGFGEIRFFDDFYSCYRKILFNRLIETRTIYDKDYNEATINYQHKGRRGLSPPPIGLLKIYENIEYD